jgi:hypothetical protein
LKNWEKIRGFLRQLSHDHAEFQQSIDRLIAMMS